MSNFWAQMLEGWLEHRGFHLSIYSDKTVMRAYRHGNLVASFSREDVHSPWRDEFNNTMNPAALEKLRIRLAGR